jgi:hypothetical protein
MASFSDGMDLSFLGAMAKAVGTYNSADARKRALQNEGQIAEYQAQIARANTDQQEADSRLRAAGLFGAQRAQLAANGVDLGSGGALDILQSTQQMGAHDASVIRDNGTRKAWAMQQGAAVDRSVADSMNPLQDAMGSLIADAGSVNKAWYRWKKEGGTGPSMWGN